MTDLNTLSEDELGSAIESAGLRLAELARRRLAHQVRAAFPAAAALRVEPIDTGGHAVLRVLDPAGAVLASADDDDDLDFGPQADTDIATVVLYGPQRPDQDGTLTVTFAPVFVAREDALDTVLAAARAAAGRIDGRFLIRDLMPVLDELERSRTWLVMAVKTLVDRSALQRVDGEAPGTYRVVNTLHRIVSGNSAYGAGTDLEEVKELADRLFRERNWQGDIWYTEWQRRGETWSLVASDGEENDDGQVSGFHSGVRIESVDVDAPGALAAGQDPQDQRPFLVTVSLPQGGEAIRYQPVGQAAAETILAQSMRHGSRVLAVLDFDAFDADEPLEAS